MATISTLAVNLIARTSAFEKGMKRGKKSVKTFRTSLVATGKRIALFGAAIASTGLILGRAFVKNTLASLDVVAKLSRRIDIAHESLLGLQHAASLAGVTNEALNKSLEIFVRRMGEVKSGSGEAKRGLEALGLSAEKMIRMTPEKALLVIADRIQELGTQAEKSAAAYFLFGRSGAQLLNLFEEGADGIARAQEEARKLGITLEGLDLSKIEAANDAATRMESAFKSLGQEITIKLAPALETLANIMQRMLGKDPLLTGRAPFEFLEPTAGFKRVTENLKTIEGINKELEIYTKRIARSIKLGEKLSEQLGVEGLRVGGLDRQKKIVEFLQKKLAVMTKEKKLADDLEAKDKKRLEFQKSQLTLMQRVQAEAQNIIKNVFSKLGDRPETETGPGRFQQIRSAFIDVAALNPATNPVTELKLLNLKTDTTNELLRLQIRGIEGVHQA